MMSCKKCKGANIKRIVAVVVSIGCVCSSNGSLLANPYYPLEAVEVDENISTESDEYTESSEFDSQWDSVQTAEAIENSFEGVDEAETIVKEEEELEGDIETDDNVEAEELEERTEKESFDNNGETNNQISLFVQSAYRSLLSEEADNQYVEKWELLFSSNQAVAADFIAEIVEGAVFQQLEISDEECFQRIAQACLGRAFSEREVKDHLGLIDEGFSRNKVLESVVNSSEFQERCDEMEIGRGHYYSEDVLDRHVMTTRFVNRLYSVTLNRIADVLGRRNWVELLVDGSANAAKTAWGFLNSVEYLSFKKSDDEYIEDLYQLFLGRASDDLGKRYWLETAESGVSRKYLARGFAGSEEFSQLCDTYKIKRGDLVLSEARDVHPKIASMVVGYYTTCLGRHPSASEINSWIEEVISSYASTLVYGVFHSKEYLALKKSNKEFVEDVYKAVLLRNPDQGSKGWIEKLKNENVRDNILFGFIISDEFRNLCESIGVQPGEEHRFPRAVEVLNKVGWTLRKAYNWSSGMPYYGHTDDMPSTPENGHEWFANYAYDNYKGNCYCMAGTFYEMATELGYKARQVYGRVPRRDGTYSTHSWVEIIIKGTTYVFDPQFEGKTGRNGYYFTYGTSGTWRYIKDGTMATW